MNRLRDFLNLYEQYLTAELIVTLITACSLVVILLILLRRRSNEVQWHRNYTQALTGIQPDIVWLKDRDGVVIACNTALARLYSMRENDIVGKSDYDLVEEETADMFRNSDLQAIEAGMPIRCEERFVSKSGECHLFETTKSPMFNKNGDVIGVLGIAHDVTAKRQTESSLQSSERLFSAADGSPL